MNFTKEDILLVAVDEDDRKHLHKRDHHQADGTGETVEHLEPVFSGSGAEDQTNEETDGTNHT